MGEAVSENCNGKEFSDCVLMWILPDTGSLFEAGFGGYEDTVGFVAEVCRLRLEMPEDLRSRCIGR